MRYFAQGTRNLIITDISFEIRSRNYSSNFVTPVFKYHRQVRSTEYFAIGPNGVFSLLQIFGRLFCTIFKLLPDFFLDEKPLYRIKYSFLLFDST